MRQCLICGNRFVPWRDEMVFCTPCVETHTGAELDAIKQAPHAVNVHAIAALPDLLAALEVWDAWLESGGVVDGGNLKVNEIITLVADTRAAVAKARIAIAKQPAVDRAAYDHETE